MEGGASSRPPQDEVGPARAAGDSRDRLVRAAVELILEHHAETPDPRDVFAFLTPGAVAARAGVSRGLIYHHWGAASGEAGSSGETESEPFSRFLAAVTEQLWLEVAVPEDLADLADLLPDNLSDVVVALSTFEQARLTGPDRALARAILALSLYGVSSPADTGRSVDRLARLYERLFVKLGRETVPPLTTEDVAFTVMCLLDGFTVNEPAMPETVFRRHDWQPAIEPATPDLDWTLIAIAVEAIALRMTRPVEGA